MQRNRTKVQASQADGGSTRTTPTSTNVKSSIIAHTASHLASESASFHVLDEQGVAHRPGTENGDAVDHDRVRGPWSGIWDPWCGIRDPDPTMSESSCIARSISSIVL